MPLNSRICLLVDMNTLRVPTFADVHVHFREPGFEYKETIASGAAAALAGGYTDVCTMPNLNPVPDSVETLNIELGAISAAASKTRVHPFGAMTKGEKGKEIADIEEIAPFVCGYSDDGHGVQDDVMMREIMSRVKAVGKVISAHCEVNSLLVPGGCIHDGQWAAEHGFQGISSESEWKMVERDLNLVRDIGCRYHVCHVSTRESVDLIRAAKADGLPVSCETGPHYLVMTDADLKDEGRFKMNPPVRSSKDRDALIAGLLDGTIDCIATDHAPHSAEEKGRGLAKSAFGIVGLETAFPLLYTLLAEPGIIPLERIVRSLSSRPREIFDIPQPDSATEYVEIITGVHDVIDSSRFQSNGRSTPFDGWEVHCRIERVVVG